MGNNREIVSSGSGRVILTSILNDLNDRVNN